MQNSTITHENSLVCSLYIKDLGTELDGVWDNKTLSLNWKDYQ